MLRLGLCFLLALALGALVATIALAPRAGVQRPSATSTAPSVPIASNVDEPMHHLPAWVQTRRVATLWSGADGQALRYEGLPAWTFLEVTGAQHDRLRVNYLGDGGTRMPAPGWVAVDDVQPSDAGGAWLRNHRASSFADSRTPIPQWSWLLALDGTRPNLQHVRAYSSDLRTVIGEGWLPTSDIGPTGPPERAVYTAGQSAPPAAFSSHDAFIESVGAAARDLEASTGVPASVTVAQAILESNWGGSLLTRQANNYFGMKAMGRLGNDGAVWMRTLEYGGDGDSFSVTAPFRAYRSLADSLADHADLFNRLPLYQGAMRATGDPDEFARRIANAGYATDPAYAPKLIALMQRYDLYRFDSPASGPVLALGAGAG